VKKINKNHRLGGPSIYSERLEREAKILSNLSHPNIIGFRAFKPGTVGMLLHSDKILFSLWVTVFIRLTMNGTFKQHLHAEIFFCTKFLA
jgi:hypothetical protein